MLAVPRAGTQLQHHRLSSLWPHLIGRFLLLSLSFTTSTHARHFYTAALPPSVHSESRLVNSVSPMHVCAIWQTILYGGASVHTACRAVMTFVLFVVDPLCWFDAACHPHMQRVSFRRV